MKKVIFLLIDTLKSQKPIRFLAFGICLLCMACGENPIDPTKNKPFEGPTMKTFDLVTNYSDSGKVKIRVKAPLQLEYQSGNQEFPKGITIDFFNYKGEVYSRLSAKQAFYEKNKNEYTALGNVVVENITNKETLKTEELHWTPTKQEIYTDKAVTITTPKELLKGNGLVAAQDFAAYEIKKPTGVFALPKK